MSVVTYLLPRNFLKKSFSCLLCIFSTFFDLVAFCKFQAELGSRICVGILEQSMGAKNRVGIGLSTGPRKATKAGGINSLESIPGLLKSLKVRAHKSLMI